MSIKIGKKFQTLLTFDADNDDEDDGMATVDFFLITSLAAMAAATAAAVCDVMVDFCDAAADFCDRDEGVFDTLATADLFTN